MLEMELISFDRWRLLSISLRIDRSEVPESIHDAVALQRGFTDNTNFEINLGCVV